MLREWMVPFLKENIINYESAYCSSVARTYLDALLVVPTIIRSLSFVWYSAVHPSLASFLSGAKGLKLNEARYFMSFLFLWSQHYSLIRKLKNACYTQAKCPFVYRRVSRRLDIYSPLPIDYSFRVFNPR